MSLTNAVIQSNIAAVQSHLSTSFTTPDLVVATKYATPDQIRAIIAGGIHLIGENKVKEAIQKKVLLQSQSVCMDAVEWHMIGHLQRNKVNKAIQTFDVIQSIDSISLLTKLNESLVTSGKTIRGYLQVNIGNDPQKFGFTSTDIKSRHAQLFAFKNVIIEGIMIVTPQDCDESKRKKIFKKSFDLFTWMQTIHSSIKTLSMGMSNDYRLAAEAGATMVRLGQCIFKQ
jgi:pyridoxal phosphate enzyme (YggS family)